MKDHKTTSSGSLLMTTLSLGLPLVIYNLVLLERKYSFLLSRGAFLQQPLNWWEKILFPALLALQILVLLLTVSAICRWLVRKVTRHTWTDLIGVPVALAYFVVVTVQFGVWRYFRDGIDLAQARELGGGGLSDALAFVKSELVGLLPLVVGGLVVAVVGLWALRRYGKTVKTALGRMRFARFATSAKGLVVLNLVMLVLPLPVLALSRRLDGALNRSMAHLAYKTPASYATDFDFDGYGLMNRPFDHAPFDGDLHPYAVDKPGNGIDEDGIGGDLPQALWRDPMGEWDESKLRRRNVVLVVFETARHDLLDSEVDGTPVMPILRAVEGDRLCVISHIGFTRGIVAVFNGTITMKEPGTSLIDRFNRLGYETGVFSGQPGDFAEIAEHAGLRRADAYWDALSFPIEKRMYPSTVLSSLTVPGPLVAGKFGEWLAGLDASQPFFAYVNFQEMHFPYNAPTIPNTVVKEPLPRSEITPENRDRLRQTYFNAAREADRVFGTVLDMLRERGLFEDTLIVVVGDHGEELFDHGTLGHGIDLCYEQNATLCKVIHGSQAAPSGPIGARDIPYVVYNGLVKDPADAAPLGEPVFGCLGNPLRPRQIGLFDQDGLRRYDFIRGLWTHQSKIGAKPVRCEEAPAVIHAWESYRYLRSRRATAAKAERKD